MAKKILGAVVLQLQAENKRLNGDLKKANATLKRQGRLLERTAKQTSAKISNAFKGALAGAFAGAGLVSSVKGIASITDELKGFEGRLKLVTKSQEEFESSFKAVADIANETRSGLGATVQLYSRLAQASGDLGLSQKDLIELTGTLNKSFQVSGASQEEAQRAAFQLSQAIAGGTLRAEEFNSILDQTPRLTRAIAEGLGVNAGKLRELVNDGRISSKALVDAVRTQTRQINEEFESLPVTVDQSLTKLRNKFTLAFQDVDVSPLIEQINRLTKALTNPEVIKGLTAIAGGIVKVSSVAANSVGKIGEFAKFIGERFAATVNGNVNDLDDIARRIKNTSAQLIEAQRLVDGSGGAPGAVRRFEEVQSTLNSLRREYIELRKEFSKPAVAKVEVPSSAASGPSTISLDPPKKKKTGKSEAERRAEVSAGLISGLRDELALAQALTVEEKSRVQAAIERRNLTGADVQLGAQLQDQIRFAEARQKQIDLDRQNADLAKSVISDLEKQVSGYNDLSESAQILVDLETGRYKALDGPSKQRIEQLAREVAEQEKIKEAAEKALKEQEEQARKLEQTAKEFGNTFSSAFEDAIVEGSKFSDVLKGLEKDILRIINRKLFLEPLQQGISSLISGSGSGSGGGLFGFLSGARENGGSVIGGRSYLVGEGGPEIYTPRSSGEIISNSESKKMLGQTQQVVFNITTPNADSFMQSQDQIAAAGASIAQRAARRNG